MLLSWFCELLQRLISHSVWAAQTATRRNHLPTRHACKLAAGSHYIFPFAELELTAESVQKINRREFCFGSYSFLQGKQIDSSHFYLKTQSEQTFKNYSNDNLVVSNFLWHSLCCCWNKTFMKPEGQVCRATFLHFQFLKSQFRNDFWSRNQFFCTNGLQILDRL